MSGAHLAASQKLLAGGGGEIGHVDLQMMSTTVWKPFGSFMPE